MRFTALVAICAIAGSAAAQQAATTPVEVGPPPNWDVLLRPRTHSATPTTAAITAADLATRLYIFADDSMQGRLLATPGNVKGVDYIASEVKRMGLIPMGDDGSYFQTVNLVDRTFDDSTRLSAGSTSFTPWTDYILRVQGTGPQSLDGARVIYGGTWGDSASLIDAAAAAGKLVVLNATPRGTTQGIRVSAVIRRFPQAAGIAAAAMELIPPQMQQALRRPSQSLKQDEAAAALPTFLYVTKRTASALLGAPIDSAKPGALGVTISSTPRFKERPVEYPARNVVAMIPGSDPKLRNEFVAIGAHNDHIGFNHEPVDHDSLRAFNAVVRPGGEDDAPRPATADEMLRVRAILDSLRRLHAPRRDSIYNGADDDGSGTVAVLEIAEALASAPVKPKRSILFIWHAGEEEGLWGSEYFTDHPTVPRDSIVTELNIDMIGRGRADDVKGGGPGYVQLIGSRRLSTELGDLVESVAKTEPMPFKFDYQYDANGHPQQYYCRSDHYEYARYGIPIVFFSTGGHRDYHQVTDEPQYIDYDQLARVSSLVRDVAIRAANIDHRLVVDKHKPDPHGQCVQ